MGSLRFALVVILATVLLLAAAAGVGFLILLALLKELAAWM